MLRQQAVEFLVRLFTFSITEKNVVERQHQPFLIKQTWSVSIEHRRQAFAHIQGTNHVI